MKQEGVKKGKSVREEERNRGRDREEHREKGTGAERGRERERERKRGRMVERVERLCARKEGEGGKEEDVCAKGSQFTVLGLWLQRLPVTCCFWQLTQLQHSPASKHYYTSL